MDAAAKALGEGLFADDVVLTNMLHAKALRSKYPRARVLKIDLTRALAHPECARILTAKDVPFNKTGHDRVRLGRFDRGGRVHPPTWATPSCWPRPSAARRWTKSSRSWTWSTRCWNLS